MKIKNIIAVLLLVVSVQALGQGNAGMQRLPNGLQYKIYTANPGPKIKLNDIITFNFLQKTDKDSILVNSFEVNRPAMLQVTPTKNIADLMDFFPLLALNDSALVIIPTDSIFNGPQMEGQRPPFLPKGSSLHYVIKIAKIQSMEEAMAEQQKVMDGLKSKEAEGLAKYIADNKINAIKTASDLRYIITKPSAKAKPVKGDTVLVNYVGKTLQGKVFDSSIEAEAKKAGLEQPGRTYEPISVVLGQGSVIPGWEEGLLLLNEGSKATFIIPSQLAYGPQAMSEDIQAFSTLVFDLEVVKVKRAKKLTVPAAKKPASKPVAKKPASPAKPVAKKPAAKAPAKAAPAKTTTTKKN
ncbi:FKBP-type peptidyl-prolyl cis-trans isomerase [Paradesertivirga mongoliensis]|uniref:peptidylprolyl isomerase n=1 Tax=Paradesertivirga mongoliensis TaxID=2100740 RepID=A0ABW4ZJ53_9SPHI|nr:FKBP-type peptidyl-prolyl cis-trans isomerase [Pedobacter mongoliensis]